MSNHAKPLHSSYEIIFNDKQNIQNIKEISAIRINNYDLKIYSKNIDPQKLLDFDKNFYTITGLLNNLSSLDLSQLASQLEGTYLLLPFKYNRRKVPTYNNFAKTLNGRLYNTHSDLADALLKFIKEMDKYVPMERREERCQV